MSKSLLLLLILASFSSIFAQEKFTISGKILTLQDDGVWSGLPGVKICIQRTTDKVIVGRGESKTDGSYTVEYLKTRTINALYGNALYPTQVVPSLSGETNHSLTKVLSRDGGNESGQRAKFSTEQSHAIISAYALIQSKPESFEPEMRQAAMKLDETLFPTDVQKQINELRLNAIIQEQRYQSMVAGTFSGVVVGQLFDGFKVRAATGEEYSWTFATSLNAKDSFARVFERRPDDRHTCHLVPTPQCGDDAFMTMAPLEFLAMMRYVHIEQALSLIHQGVIIPEQALIPAGCSQGSMEFTI